MNIENKVRTSRSGERLLDTVSSEFGPNTAGLAQRMYATQEKSKSLYVLKKAYILSCSVNQF